jgi:aminopeptidase N
VASTGRKLNVEAVDGTRVFRLSAQNVRGFTIYASPDWVERRRTAAGVDLGVHLPADAADAWADRLLEAAAEAIAFYGSEYGDFPSEHLDVICPGSLGGAAHGSSATCNGITIWLHGQLEKQYRYAVAHEIAHQYFGNSLGIDRREIAWAPIGLGLAMDHAFAQEYELDVAAFDTQFQWFYFEAERRGFDTTLSQPVEQALREPPPWSSGWNMSLMHAKAYEVCTMLEGLLGEDKFREVIRDILRDKKDGVFTGAELVARCQAVSDQPLDWFVAQWIEGRGKLDYAVTSVESVDGAWDVEISRIGAATYPVVVEAETVAGEHLRQRIDRGRTIRRLRFESSGEVSSVVVDPEEIAPDFDRANNVWRRPSD